MISKRQSYPMITLLFLWSLSTSGPSVQAEMPNPENTRKTESYKLIRDAGVIAVGAKLDLISERLREHPRELAEALLVYATYDIKDDLGRFIVFESCIPVLGVWAHDALRPELIRYLALKADGTLEDIQDGVSTIAGMAHYLLRAIDQTAKVPSRLKQKTRLPGLKESYLEVIREYKGKMPEALVEYLFQEFREEAWKWMSEAQVTGTQLTTEKFELASHVIQTTAWRLERGYKELADIKLAQRELERLANDSAWYSRRYVVHVLLKYPFFRTPELVKRLQEDKHPLVRDRAKFISLSDR